MNSVSTNFTNDSQLGSISNSEIREVSPRYLKRFRSITGNNKRDSSLEMQADTSKSK